MKKIVSIMFILSLIGIVGYIDYQTKEIETTSAFSSITDEEIQTQRTYEKAYLSKYDFLVK